MFALKLNGKAMFIVVLTTMILFCRSCIDAAPNVNTVQTEGKQRKTPRLHIIFPDGIKESDLPKCEEQAVCSRIDTYSRPWVEKLCSCDNGKGCSTSLRPDDGYTVTERYRQYKLCQPVKNLPRCRLFRDVTWTYFIKSRNSSQQKVHCVCPENSSPYLSSHQSSYHPKYGAAYQYHFSCSPRSEVQCKRKEPCRLFSLNKRHSVNEVTTSTLCKCPPMTSCPKFHTDPNVLAGSDPKVKVQDRRIRSYSGYCGPTVR